MEIGCCCSVSLDKEMSRAVPCHWIGDQPLQRIGFLGSNNGPEIISVFFFKLLITTESESTCSKMFITEKAGNDSNHRCHMWGDCLTNRCEIDTG